MSSDQSSSTVRSDAPPPLQPINVEPTVSNQGLDGSNGLADTIALLLARMETLESALTTRPPTAPLSESQQDLHDQQDDHISLHAPKSQFADETEHEGVSSPSIEESNTLNKENLSHNSGIAVVSTGNRSDVIELFAKQPNVSASKSKTGDSSSNSGSRGTKRKHEEVNSGDIDVGEEMLNQIAEARAALLQNNGPPIFDKLAQIISNFWKEDQKMTS